MLPGALDVPALRLYRLAFRVGTWLRQTGHMPARSIPELLTLPHPRYDPHWTQALDVTLTLAFCCFWFGVV